MTWAIKIAIMYVKNSKKCQISQILVPVKDQNWQISVNVQQKYNVNSTRWH